MSVLPIQGALARRREKDSDMVGEELESEFRTRDVLDLTMSANKVWL
jgi:hypothetical protein